MGKYLDLDDVCADNPVAQDELDDLRTENAKLRDYVGDGLLRSDFKSAAEMRIEINRLKAEVAALLAENKHLRLIGESALKVCNELDEVTLALPMDYLDPPDGGNVSLGVQVERMKAHRDELIAEVARQHAEILHLRTYAPGQHATHAVKTIPRVGETNWRFYGLALAEADFDSFCKLVPNATEA